MIAARWRASSTTCASWAGASSPVDAPAPRALTCRSSRSSRSSRGGAGQTNPSPWAPEQRAAGIPIVDAAWRTRVADRRCTSRASGAKRAPRSRRVQRLDLDAHDADAAPTNASPRSRALSSTPRRSAPYFRVVAPPSRRRVHRRAPHRTTCRLQRGAGEGGPRPVPQRQQHGPSRVGHRHAPRVEHVVRFATPPSPSGVPAADEPLNSDESTDRVRAGSAPGNNAEEARILPSTSPSPARPAPARCAALARRAVFTLRRVDEARTASTSPFLATARRRGRTSGRPGVHAQYNRSSKSSAAFAALKQRCAAACLRPDRTGGRGRGHLAGAPDAYLGADRRRDVARFRSHSLPRHLRREPRHVRDATPLTGCRGPAVQAFNTLNQATPVHATRLRAVQAFATSPPSARRRTSSEAQFTLRAGAGVALRCWSASGREAAPSGVRRATARDARGAGAAAPQMPLCESVASWSSRTPRPPWESTSRESRSAFRFWAAGLRATAAIRASPQQFAGVFVSSNLATRLWSVKLVCVAPARLRRQPLQVRSPRGALLALA